MKNSRDITSSLILIVIILVISALVYYLFFYSGSKPESLLQGQKTDRDTFSTPFLSPNTIFEKRKSEEEALPKKSEKPSKEKDSAVEKDRQPSPKPFRDIDNENQENSQALDQIRTDMDNLVAFINQRSLQQFLQEMVSGFEIGDGGNRLTIYVADTWYYLPPIQKQVMFNLIAMRYARQTCIYKIRSECSKDDFPTINFLNHENREVAKMAAHQPLQIFE
jgi:hypothetical protein